MFRDEKEPAFDCGFLKEASEEELAATVIIGADRLCGAPSSRCMLHCMVRYAMFNTYNTHMHCMCIYHVLRLDRCFLLPLSTFHQFNIGSARNAMFNMVNLLEGILR